MKPETSRLLLYATPEHDCSYLPGKRAVTQFLDPSRPRDPALYSALSRHGFRRSGEHIYRPACHGCSDCIPVRVRAARFTPRRGQRRAWSRNGDLTVRVVEPTYEEEHFDLYRRYQEGRHAGGGMDDPTPGQYLDFLTSPWSSTFFAEFRLADRLQAVAVIDRLGDGLSAVYTFFEPAAAQRSLGTFTILWEIRHAETLGLDWLYLGYLVPGSPKMQYKSRFGPQEHYLDGRWRPAGT